MKKIPDKNKAAAHEIGHYLASCWRNIGSEYVSILRDVSSNTFGPHFRANQDVDGQILRDVLLSGWAAEAYYTASYNRKYISKKRFLLHAFWARHGAGWRLIGKLREGSDLGRFAKTGVNELTVRFPIHDLVRLANQLKEEHDAFHRLVEDLAQRSFASGEILTAIRLGHTITDEMVLRDFTLLENIIRQK